MKIVNVATIVLSLVFAIGALSYSVITQKRIGVIKLGYVFENFKGAKSAAEELLDSSEKFENTIDSLSHKLSILSLKNENEKEINNLKRVIYELRQKAEYNYGKLNDKLSHGVQNQIDTYLEIYRKENHYDVLISQYQSTGAIAVGEEMDITEEFTEALNKYYFNE